MAIRTDAEIKKDVEAELRWNPSIDPADVAVAVKNGVVTLTGFTRSFSEKWEAERAVKHVAGVVGVANDIEVRLPSVDQRPDPEIARRRHGSQEPAADERRAHPGHSEKRLGQPRRPGRVAVPEGVRRDSGALGPRREGRQQSRPGEAA